MPTETLKSHRSRTAWVITNVSEFGGRSFPERHYRIPPDGKWMTARDSDRGSDAGLLTFHDLYEAFQATMYCGQRFVGHDLLHQMECVGDLDIRTDGRMTCRSARSIRSVPMQDIYLKVLWYFVLKSLKAWDPPFEIFQFIQTGNKAHWITAQRTNYPVQRGTVESRPEAAWEDYKAARVGSLTSHKLSRQVGLHFQADLDRVYREARESAENDPGCQRLIESLPREAWYKAHTGDWMYSEYYRDRLEISLRRHQIREDMERTGIARVTATHRKLLDDVVDEVFSKPAIQRSLDTKGTYPCSI